MDLSLAEAARLLGRSERQVRYLIKTGGIAARKVEGRWILDSAQLPLSEGQLRARAERGSALKGAVDEALAPHLTSRSDRCFSVRDMAAFSHGLAGYRTIRAALGPDHPAAVSLTEALAWVTRGCHRFHHRDKHDAYREAREQTATTVARLYQEGSAVAEEIAAALERDLLPVLAGLLRRAERKAAN